MPQTMPRFRLFPLLLAASALCACEVGPNYHRPSAPTPASGAYKEIQGWTLAHPSDAADRADWWTVFNDPILNDLEQKVATSNQTLASAEAAYRAARALVAEQRAQLWPTLSANGSANVSHGGSGGGAPIGGNGAVVGGGGGTVQNYSLQLGATWEPDIWGKVRRQIENAKGNAQSNYADIVNTRLSSQMELAADYITLRELDEEKRLDDDTVKAYAQSLDVTRNKYNAGNAALSDVDAAETQLHNAKAADIALAQTRAQTEHAIAVLVGEAPADLTIAPAPWTLQPLDIPPGVPSTLLQRRPDVAANERLAAAASANIGVAVAGYYPDITLSGAGGTEAAAIGQLFSPSTFFWNAGVSAAETIFNGGLTHAQVQNARASYDQAVANYRQTVLTAFQQVEDNLAAQRVLAQEQPELQAAVVSSDQDLRILQNQYKAGTVDYTSVVVAETQDYSARNAEIQVEANRLTTTVDLVVALGGGWNADELKNK
jgi:NodT family efflux transporter outer membrane factor (OMF) lipoprotein